MPPTPSMSVSTIIPLNSVKRFIYPRIFQKPPRAMVLSAPTTLVLPTVDNGRKVTDQIYSEADHVDMYEVAGKLHESKFPVAGEPTTMIINKENQQKEKQISVDPISLKELSVTDESSKISFSIIRRPIYPSPAKPKLLSFSLPNSASSSPRFSTSSRKKIPAIAHRESDQLRRSKSCGERRSCAPSDEFDLWLNGTDINSEVATTQNTEARNDERKRDKDLECPDDGFKCGALCLFLPGFGRGKPVRARKENPAEVNHNNNEIISRTVSLEKFECASWASSAIANSNFEEDGESMNLYFDLPLELIRTSVNEANSPVASAFVFDKSTKGVLKNSMGRGARKSQESSRHVRFSTSTPTSYPSSPSSPSSCITPRLRKAREDFNAYLEAQS